MNNLNIKKFDWSAFALGTLAAAISLTPRIPLPIVIGGNRILDIRFEDILISIFLFLGLIYLVMDGRFRFPLALPITLYFGAGILSSALGVAFYNASTMKSLFYNLKELEYYLIFLFAANLALDEKTLKKVIYAIMICGGLNIVWGMSQIMGWVRGPLFILDLTGSAADIAGARFTSYGVTTLGEFSPFSTALYFAFISYLFYSFAKVGGRRAAIIGAAGAAASLCSFMTGEKISVVLFLLALTALNIGKIYTPRRFIWIAAALTLFISLILSPVMDYRKISGYVQNNTAIGKRFPSIARILDREAYILRPGRSGKRGEQWMSMIENKAGTALLGSGKGNMYLHKDRSAEEAHSHYVKTFVETGFFGMFAFLFLVLNLTSKFISATKSSDAPYLRLAGRAALLTLGALLISGIVQDSFKPVLPNALFWLFAGLACSAPNRKDTALTD